MLWFISCSKKKGERKSESTLENIDQLLQPRLEQRAQVERGEETIERLLSQQLLLEMLHGARAGLHDVGIVTAQKLGQLFMVRQNGGRRRL